MRRILALVVALFVLGGTILAAQEERAIRVAKNKAPNEVEVFYVQIQGRAAPVPCVWAAEGARGGLSCDWEVAP